MPRNKKALYSLKRPKYRPSWNKYNLYNMTRVRDPLSPAMTYFQQKWHSKAMTRTYHATTMKEKAWRRLFRPDMRSVVSMNPGYLGMADGSEISAGRGSGKSTMATTSRSRPVPYMNMIYHQLERRLDVAIWRALFASSAKQARQFVVHGGVKVNGRKMIYPGYLLNPGDMFQVDVERVMFATGDRKNYWERRWGRQDRRRGYSVDRTSKQPRNDGEEIDTAEAAEESTEVSATDEASINSEDIPPTNQSKNKLRDLLSQAKALLDDPATKNESAAQKRLIRDFARTVRKEQGNAESRDKPISEEITELAAKLSLDIEDQQSQQAVTASPDSKSSGIKPAKPLTQTLIADEQRLLAAALKQLRENPVDYTKGYKTPWQPRPYMSPFAFIPRYLEVHAPICAAVYLRHPVARTGLSEVPTPYSELHNGLAFNWYLRRR